MASSSSSEHHHPLQGPPPQLARQNSSFLGAIKNIVTAPLTWFGQIDEHGDAAGTPTGAKRRRPVVQASTELVLPSDLPSKPTTRGESREHEDDEATRRSSKRMRLHSPPVGRRSNGRPGSDGYNDPPASAFERSATGSMRRASLVPRASSAVLPSSRPRISTRATVSPLRHPPHAPPSVQRTMSIDPPYYTSSALRRDASFNFGSAMDLDMAMDTDRDGSLPPSPRSPRPSFRMRSSMTPQPQHMPTRHISEPPPLNALISKPVFLHQPVQPPHDPTPAPTLGSLVESTRVTRSPVRQQHSSLLLGRHDNEEKDAPAERALHQLDVYKTPLLPTRMRSSNDYITAKVIPDMFKSRRSSRLVLMSDDGERSSKKSNKNKSPQVNETKPYAGEGGMRKLLARAKLEAEKEEGPSQSRKTEETEEESRASQVSSSSTPSLPPPPPAGSDWFSTATSSTSSGTSGSSLRVGRQKTSRNHIQRPTRSRFSAVEEDDGEDIEDESTRQERKMLEEAAKKVPVFQIPAGFSFAKDTPAPVVPAAEIEKAAEPPIQSLPFSFSKPATPQPAAEPQKVDAQPTSIFGAPSTSSSSTTEPKAPAPSSFFNIAPKPAAPNGVPNFFGNSAVLKSTTIPTPPPVINFGATSNATPPPAAPFSFGAPPATSDKVVKDTDNPFWDGDKNKAADPKPLPSLFGGPALAKSTVESPAAPAAAVSKPTENVVTPAPALFPFAKPAEVNPPVITTTAPTPTQTPFSIFGKTAEDRTAPTSSSPFSFGKPAEDKPPATSAPPSLPFSFGAKPETVKAEPKPLFGATTAATGSLFEEPKSAASPFPAAPPQSTPSPLPFTFGAPTNVAPPGPALGTQAFAFGTPSPASSPAVEAPKPLFGSGAGGFSFGQSSPDKEKEVKSTPFSFGAAPSTPPAGPTADSKPAASIFNFGQSAPTAAPAAPAPVSFSFSGGGGSAGTDVSNKPAFMFGQSNAMTQPERPITPPKSQDQEFRMEESPTRDMQATGNGKEPEPRPTIGGFSFGSSSNMNGSSPFGAPQNTAPSAAPFSFGASSSASNPFGAKKAEEPKPFGGFGGPQAPQITTSFSFGQQKEEARPVSAGGFSFGQTPTSATNAPPAFSFGQPANSNPFGQPSAGSAPSSPSTFNQPGAFSFGAPAAAAPSNPFSFGSQPASPAAVPNLTLPPPTTTFGNGGGFGQAPSPSSPFSAPTQLAPSTSSGGSLFTIGSAPAPAPAGQRAIKKLPRRGNVKR